MPATSRIVCSPACMITRVLYKHQERCGACDTTRAHRQGDRVFQGYVERAYAVIERVRLRGGVKGARN